MKQKFCRLAKLTPLLVLATLAGCTAVSKQSGESTVYKNSIPFVLGLTAIGAGFLFFGIGIAREAYQKRYPKRRKKKRNSRSKPPQGSPWGIVVGCGLTGIGVIIVFMGIPSSLIAYVEVAPDRVVIRDQLFWFLTSPQEFSYSSISSIDHEVVQTIARRGTRKKEYLYITHAGGQEMIEMTPIHKAAREHLEQAFANYQNAATVVENVQVQSESPSAAPSFLSGTTGNEPAGNEQPIQNSVLGNSNNTPRAGTISNQPANSINTSAETDNSSMETEDLTEVDRIGRYRKDQYVTAKDGSGKFVRSLILAVYKERKIKILYEYGILNGQVKVIPLTDTHIAVTAKVPMPGVGPGREINSIDEVSAGMQLIGHHDGDWFPVEVTGIRREKPVIRFVGEKTETAVPLRTVRFSE